MKKEKLLLSTISMVLFLLTFSCSTEEDSVVMEDPTPLNAIPIMENQQFEVPESIGSFKPIGTLVASDADGDPLTFKLESDIDLNISPTTGVVSTKGNSILDYETATSLSFDVSVKDSKGGSTRATVRINVTDVDDGPLTNYEKSFIDEYIYLTYKLSPTASGGLLSEKWQGDVKLYMQGDLPEDYQQTVQGYLDEFNSFLSDGTNIVLVDTLEESNVLLVMGPTSTVATLWPDMYSQIKDGTFGGYALYDTDVDYNIYNGRIWMVDGNEALFKHEFGHIIGLGHTSDTYCDDQISSVMCPGAASEFNTFDGEIIKSLYRTETPVGLNQIEMRALVTSYLLQGDISL
ncbi:MAG: hypothetical protein HKN53_10430 [Maribacter sp.]|nr:hypothetical protein [Maribacter sp.]